MKSLYNLFTTKGQLMALVLALIVIAISVMSIFGGLSAGGFDVGTDLNAVLKSAKASGGDTGFGFLNSAIFLPVLLIAVATLLWIVFTVVQIFSDFKNSSKIVIAFVIILVMFFLFKSMSDSETTGKLALLLQKNGVSDGVSTSISGGIKTTLVLAVLGVVLMIVMEILNMFK